MTEDNELEMMRKLEALRQEHRRLDDTIFALTRNTPDDAFNIASLKRQKLRIRDEMIFIESMVYPDIIA